MRIAAIIQARARVWGAGDHRWPRTDCMPGLMAAWSYLQHPGGLQVIAVLASFDTWDCWNVIGTMTSCKEAAH